MSVGNNHQVHQPLESSTCKVQCRVCKKFKYQPPSIEFPSAAYQALRSADDYSRCCNYCETLKTNIIHKRNKFTGTFTTINNNTIIIRFHRL